MIGFLLRLFGNFEWRYEEEKLALVAASMFWPLTVLVVLFWGFFWVLNSVAVVLFGLRERK
jgi:hypothetical protein